MGSWYRVTKTIKGHSYIYEQQTYRDGRRVRTRNRYIGPAGGDGGSGKATSPSVTTTTTRRQRSVGTSFGKAFLDQFGGVDVWGQATLAQLGMADAKARKVKAVTTTTRQHKQKIFLGEKDGKKYYLIVEGTDEALQATPPNEIWLLPDE